ncbi:MAG: hypothetical protein EOO62_19335 [Hymenobacter sp.]|nr:MAG: hypothetical protein EOO62_19335 [Hymenobacter sp.]
MKSSVLLFAGFAALSLGACSSNNTDSTTATTPADPSAMATSATTTTTSDETYHSRGNRMADKFASDMKITDDATKEKLRTAYYNRSKRYGEMHSKYASDTTGMGAAMRQYNTDTDTEFQGVLSNPDQYKSYQSSRSTYDEASNMDTADQGAAASSATMPDASSSSTTTTTSTNGSDMSSNSDMSGSGGGAAVKSSKTKLEDGSKVKVKDDGTVKLKDSDGSKTKL